MRIYIIGNDGITLCREAPATLSDDEVAVASKEQLHAAPLSGKRLLARGTLCPVSRNGGKLATARPSSISCGRRSRPYRSRHPTLSAHQSRTR